MNASITHSAMEEINAALHSHNPFAQPPFVNANNVWGKGFPDVETLNAHASDAVFKALEDVRTGQYSTTSILITAQNGTGKTHIIGRIRHRLQTQGNTLFVYANKFNDLDQIRPGFQQILADSLSQIGSEGAKQWQELAAAMTGEVLSKTNSKTQISAAKNLVKSFEKMGEKKAGEWVDKLAKTFCKLKSVQDPDVIRAIFWTLVESESQYAANWLAGKALAQFKADELRLPSQNQSFDAVLQILALISEYYELMICFDELDILDCNSAGLYKAQVIANLVKELFENLQRGVILTVMMPGTWKERVLDQLPAGVCNRLSAHRSQPYDLTYLDSDSTVELVSLFLKDYYSARELVPPHPVYPFDEKQLRVIGQGKPTVREVLTWCRENCKAPEIACNTHEQLTDHADNSTDPVELAFVSELDENIGTYLDDNRLIADALLFGFQGLIGQTVERVTIKNVTIGVKKRNGKDPYLNFKIVGDEESKPVAIGVAVLQYDGGGGLGAGFKRLLDKDGVFGLTRGCLVRSETKPMKNHFKKTYLNPLIAQGGEFVKLKEIEIKPLIALRSVYQKRESDYKVTEEQICQFIENKGKQYFLGVHNPLLLEILSDPSYQVPGDIPDELESVDLKPIASESFSDSAETEDFTDLVTESADE